MATRVRVELNKAGIKELLNSQDLADAVQKVMDPILEAAGEGHNSRVYRGKDRVRGQIWTGTYEAKLAEAEDRNLTLALDAGRI